MTTRYGNHDTEDVHAPPDSTPLDIVPPDHTMPGQESESYDEYSKETDTHHPLAKLQEQFRKLEDQLTHLKCATHTYGRGDSVQIGWNTYDTPTTSNLPA